jgi:predicted phosphate transport protein (TIGR00153 family)
MRGLFFDFFSHRALFYGLFDRAGGNIVEMADLLSAIVNTESGEEREAFYRQVNALEETGDDITHKIYLGLNKIFFTPFNRKDIHLLASAIDDVADNMHEATGKMQLYEVKTFLPAINEMVKYIWLSCDAIKQLISSLSKVTATTDMLSFCRVIKNHEHETDLIYYHALADLFANEKDAITLIKHRDILFSLEESANKCKNVADTLEVIILNSI